MPSPFPLCHKYLYIPETYFPPLPPIPLFSNMPPTQNDQRGHDYSPLPQSELYQARTRDEDDDQEHPLSTSTTDSDSSDNETRNREDVDVEPQNERDHDVKFSPLPENSEPDHGQSSEDRDLPLSISVEYTRPTTEYYSDEMQNDVNINGNTETAQDLLGLTVLLMLIFSPLYKRMESPTGDPIPPLFTLNSMYVSNFNAANGTLSAIWDAKLTVVNANVSSIYFKHTDFIIFYNDNPEDALSGLSLNPFYLDEGEAVKLHLKFTTSGGAWDENEPSVESWLAEQIGKDKARDGSLNFGMQMNVEAIYYGETWVSDVDMSPHCEGLRVQFLPNQGSGRMTLPDRNFSVPIGWKPFSLF